MKIIITLLFLFSIRLSAQSRFSISGEILNQKNQRVELSEVNLIDGQDHIIRTVFSQDGTFEFKEVDVNTYFIQIINRSRIQNELPFALNADYRIKIIFRSDVTELEELKIVKNRNAVKVDNGNLSIDIANSVLSKVANVTDLLSRLPFIRIDPNGENLYFVGKGIPLLYIDNQRVDFSVMSALSVDDIQSIELIRNPGIRYEAEGKAVIKVTIKKNKKDNQKLILTETGVFQKKYSNYLSGNYQSKKNKTEWKLNASYNQVNHWESNGFDYQVDTKSITSDYIIKSVTKRPQLIFGANFYQELGEEGDYISLALNSNMRPDKGNNNTVTNYAENTLITNVQTLNRQDKNRATVNAIFNFNKNLPKLEASVFTGFQYKRESDNVDYDFYDNKDFSGYEFRQFRHQLYSGNIYSGRIDIEKKFSDPFKVQLGGSFNSAETFTDNTIQLANIQEPDRLEYLFKESNMAMYANLDLNMKKFGMKAGVRMENTIAKGDNTSTGVDDIARIYNDWFPSAQLSFEPNEHFNFSLDYRRSITRPNYGNLSSGGLYGSPYVEYRGNPLLLPCYSNTITLNAKLKKWSLTASYYEDKNPMGNTLVFDEAKNISTFTIVNFDKEIGSSLGVDYELIYKKWTSQNNVSLNYDRIEDAMAVSQKSTPYLYFSTNNSYHVRKNLSFLLDYSYITNRTQGIFKYNAMCLVNLGLNASFGQFDLTARYNDVFRQMDYIQSLNYKKILSTGSFYGNTPTVSLTVKYNIGNVSKSNYKEKIVNESADRL
ncbi:outer membrane beta-barrel family protein [Chryseobacterium sp. SSA4.19]|uniref:outer membrane beta-barrel family protein n=1 Tax=Chryseobacterium sp. SSA4.19 TaxID=2919915 RepID=UPI001F4D8D30|nr:outer membrane beta-barrel family protein [Chryseobacterium sp. SSA4.19]MCJ8152753.1 outer membrane beta-barrel family protein [Chryseobacterium sp. SSA4.19]